jgi:Uma2 family endonuclease
MRAILLEVSQAELARRHRLGADRWDEMWEGVLHMTPAPSTEHQRILDRLIEWLGPRLRESGRGTLRSGINVFRTDDDYRIPDLTFVATGHEARLAEDGLRGGGPDTIIEIRSPADETYDRFSFLAALSTPEVIVIDRDTKRPEVFRLAGDAYSPTAPSERGWVVSTALGVRLRVVPGEPPRLELADTVDSSARCVI